MRAGEVETLLHEQESLFGRGLRTANSFRMSVRNGRAKLIDGEDQPMSPLVHKFNTAISDRTDPQSHSLSFLDVTEGCTTTLKRQCRELLECRNGGKGFGHSRACHAKRGSPRLGLEASQYRTDADQDQRPEHYHAHPRQRDTVVYRVVVQRIVRWINLKCGDFGLRCGNAITA